ncbi:Molybdopterin biosynthesis protein MoeA [Methylophaga frappieri]|uniref:Molybdopterin molybdenumtransferase n=1 Tax=Methylophaga frappieri (strain ATCC BAA-2434 / DSM 25690 / JAM7) TaxID=754477 RepID=I1YG11_METFJ|nr:bifunctional molybdopterin-guanine dinucleotide biosynthesis adaptor protein MobB/molybdopterin molybdotransferase MoeA [Methylophaga frappieri]AFJ01854.1 Molybdopterin biosynthesis protein MoeA [Methylophaga frappieri]
MSELPANDSCASDELPSVLRVDAAREAILSVIQPITAVQKSPIRLALNHVLAEAILSPVNVPPFDNSAMDGYAFACADLKTTAKLTMAGKALAGQPYTERLHAGECIRIMTGAVIPAGCDTVVMQEQVTVEDDLITFPANVIAGQNVRRAGEDMAKGTSVFEAGRRLQAADLGSLAAIGVAELTTYRPLRVAFFSTGDELKPIGQSLNPGDIYDSNRYTLFGMLARLHVEPIDLGVVPDQPDALRQVLSDAATKADVIISSGGVSVGEADFVKSVLQQIGQVNFWKIAMKPGRPLAFGHIKSVPFFGLPGNPVSVMVTFYQFVLPALLKLAGQNAEKPFHIQVKTSESIIKRSGRFEFQRGIIDYDAQGQLHVRLAGKQGSGILSSMSRANCFILLDETCQGVAAGDTVTVQPFAGLI